jgi:hypothetical protein
MTSYLESIRLQNNNVLCNKMLFSVLGDNNVLCNGLLFGGKQQYIVQWGVVFGKQQCNVCFLVTKLQLCR